VIDLHLRHLQSLKQPGDDPTEERDGVRNARWLTNRLRKKHGRVLVQHFDGFVFRDFIEATYTAENAASAERLINLMTTAFNRAMVPINGLKMPEGYVNPAIGLIQAIPFVRDRPKGSRAVNWSDDEWSAIFDAIRKAYGPDSTLNPICTMVIELTMLTGARPGEIARLRWEDVEDHSIVIQGATFKLKRLIVERHKTWSKTGRPRHIVIGKEGIDVLRRAKAWAMENDREDSPYVFPSPGRQTNKDPWASTTAYYAAEIKRIGNLPALMAYNFRSAYINHAIDAGVPEEIVAENVGHEDVETTRKFYRRRRDEQLAAGAITADESFTKRRLAGQKVIDAQPDAKPLLLDAQAQ